MTRTCGRTNETCYELAIDLSKDICSREVLWRKCAQDGR
jgi:hypothetical protein